MYLTIIILPLMGSIFSGFLGRKVGITGSQLITTIAVMLTAILSTVTFFEVGLNNSLVFIELFTWIDSESLNVIWGFNYDSLTVSMLIPVLIVSSLVHLYSWGYMGHDPHIQRFMSYLSLFTFMMIILVTSNNFLVMFVGWEGVGICSYLLVSFWFTRIAANQSSLSALLVNRVGDCFLTIGMFIMLLAFGNIDYATVFSLASFVNENIITIVGVCLLIGAMAKSSQLGLHVWLPQAMEGPTPVSALIHAATMVTAGVYLLMRCSPLIEYSPTVLSIAMWLGAITTLFSSLVGLFQQDIKKVIAYSTMSQLGMMVIAVGLSSYNIALFHLVNHAFYKALLFLAAGAVIHSVNDNQDFRKYGGLGSFLPLTYSVMLIASLSLVAFPFMTGFYSKDLILESAYGKLDYSSTVIYFVATIGAMFTTLYSVKVLHLTFLSNPAGPIENHKNAHEGDIYMSIPLIVLAIFSIFFGYLAKDIYIGLGSGFFMDNSIFIHPSNEILLDTEFAVPTLFKLLPFFFTILLSILGILLTEFFYIPLIYFKLSRLGYNIFSFFNQRFYVELFYNNYITNVILKLGGQTTKILDKGSIELIGPYGLEKGLLSLSYTMASLDTGVITTYALYVLLGMISYLLVPFINLNCLSIIIFVLINLSLIYKSKKVITSLNNTNKNSFMHLESNIVAPFISAYLNIYKKWTLNFRVTVKRFLIIRFSILITWTISSLIIGMVYTNYIFIVLFVGYIFTIYKPIMVNVEYNIKRKLYIITYITSILIISIFLAKIFNYILLCYIGMPMFLLLGISISEFELGYLYSGTPEQPEGPSPGSGGEPSTNGSPNGGEPSTNESPNRGPEDTAPPVGELDDSDSEETRAFVLANPDYRNGWCTHSTYSPGPGFDASEIHREICNLDGEQRGLYYFQGTQEIITDGNISNVDGVVVTRTLDDFENAYNNADREINCSNCPNDSTNEDTGNTNEDTGNTNEDTDGTNGDTNGTNGVNGHTNGTNGAYQQNTDS